MEIKQIVEGMTAPQVAQVIDDNFKAQNKFLEDDIKKQNNAIGVSEYKAFSESESVNVGDVRLYDGMLYECVEATSGAWDASKWKKSSFKAETEKKLAELGSDVGNEIIYPDFRVDAGVVTSSVKYECDFKKGDKIHIKFISNPNNYAYILGKTPNGVWVNIGEMPTGEADFVLQNDIAVWGYQFNSHSTAVEGHFEITFGLKNEVRDLRETITSVTDDIANIEKELEGSLSTYKYYIGVSSDKKTEIDNIISDIYISGIKNPGDNDVSVFYFGKNHSVFGGSNSLGLQIAFYDSGVISKPSNYAGQNVDTWLPNTLYALNPRDGEFVNENVKVYIRTSNGFKWDSNEILYAERLIDLTDVGLGYNVEPFIEKQNEIIVAKDGSGDYTTISSAAAAAPNGSIIRIKPGIYTNEIINASYSKTLYFIGEDRTKTIVKNSEADYEKAVFLMGSGCIKNLTIIEEYKEGVVPSELQAYAVHVESATLYNSSLLIQDCDIISDYGNAIGMGMRGNCDVDFDNCKFIGNNNNYGAAYIHDSEETAYIGEQNVHFLNCTIYSPNYQHALVLQSQERDGSTINIEMQNTLIKGSGGTPYFIVNYRGGTPADSDFLGLINGRLAKTSWGNSEDAFNV